MDIDIELMTNLFHDNCDPVRKQERVDGRMLQEDRKAVANMPSKPVYHVFNPDKYVEHLKQ